MDAINSCDSNQNFGDHFRWLKNVPCSICCCFYFRFSMSLSVNVFCPICWRRHPKPTAIIMSSAKWRHDLNRWVECDWRKIFHVLKLDNWNSLGDLRHFVGVLSSVVPERWIASFYSSFLVCLNVYLLFFFPHSVCKTLASTLFICGCCCDICPMNLPLKNHSLGRPRYYSLALYGCSFSSMFWFLIC